MRSLYLFLIIIFNCNLSLFSQKVLKFKGYDDYPIDNWEIRVFNNNHELDTVFRANKNGIINISDPIFNIFSDKIAVIHFERKDVLEKIYKVPKELSDTTVLHELFPANSKTYIFQKNY
jgi:hypothetical protein